MLTKSQLRETLTEALELRDVEDADDIADSIVESLDEDGAFDADEDESE